MPKVSRNKSKQHAVAVQLPSKRNFAVTGASEQIIPGSGLDSPLEHPGSIAGPSEPVNKRKKHSKDLIDQSTTKSLSAYHPYSRSHTRREKKKAKQTLAGGELHGVAIALSHSLGEEDAGKAKARVRSKAEKEIERIKTEKDEKEKNKIGEGKGRTMNEKARRKQILLEGRRIPNVMKHPAFKTDPWATIRLHASNSLVQTEKASKQDKAEVSGMQFES